MSHSPAPDSRNSRPGIRRVATHIRHQFGGVGSVLTCKPGKICIFFVLSLLLTTQCTTSECLDFRNLSPYRLWVFFPYSLLTFVFHFGFWCCFLLACTRSRVLSYVVLPLVIVTEFIVYFADTMYGAACKELAVAIVSTTPGEALFFANAQTILLFLLSVVLICAFVRLLRWTLDFPMRRRTRYMQLAMGLCGCAFFLYTPQLIKRYWPGAATESIGFVDELAFRRFVWPDRCWPVEQTREDVLQEAVYNQDYLIFDKQHQPLNSVIDFYSAVMDFYNPPPLIPAQKLPSDLRWQKPPQTVVLYLGESMRADHFPLNGYHRNTMPHMVAEPNLINLPNLHTRETQTLTAIYALLARIDPTTGQATHNSFLGIIKKHGFNMSLLVGANTHGMWYKAPTIAPLLRDNMELHARPASPTEYAEVMRERQQHPHSFVLIEDGAGHQPYDSESPVKPFGEATDIDRYDNALLDIDTRLHAIINTMRDKEAVLFFTSDHGESFGENARYGHGGPASAIEQRHVCAFIWYSDLYAQRHPEVIANLRRNAHRFTLHDQLYHTIISLCGVKSDAQLPELDMTQEQKEK